MIIRHGEEPGDPNNDSDGMAMHDIIHNAPGDSLQTILTRQGPSGIGDPEINAEPISGFFRISESGV